ncbi:tetratricopeptide repeat protein [Ekhidna sp.]|uniref:tetratricopeptide repeat-containing sensor histidine kinase n=1 Tax=Ekhidna sp. TaxID=2608089 RepID=UPI003297610F
MRIKLGILHSIVAINQLHNSRHRYIRFVGCLLLITTLFLSFELKSQVRTPPDTVMINELIEEGYKLHNNNPRSAIIKSRKALSLIGKSNQLVEKGKVYKNLGLAYWRLDMYDSSMHYNMKGKHLADSIGDHLLSSRLLNNMGLVYREKEQYALSLQTFLEVYEVQKETSDSLSIAVSLMNIGDIHRRMKNYEQALQFINQAIVIAGQINSEMVFCWGYVFSIEPTFESGNTEAAEVFFQRALDKCGAVKNFYHLSVAYVHHARILGSQKMYDQALDELMLALMLHQNQGNMKLQASTNIEIGKIFLEKENLKEAKNRFQMAFEIASNEKFLTELSNVYYYLAETYRLEKNFEMADRNFVLYHDVSKRLSEIQKGTELEAIAARNEIQQKENENSALRLESALQAEVISNQTTKTRYFYMVISIAVLLILSLALFIYVVNKKNRHLIRLNDRIVRKSEELEMANEEVETKNEELLATLNKLQKTKEKLVETEKMASLGMLSAGVGHEINNPLNFIKNSIQIIRNYKVESKNDEENYDRFIKIIDDGVVRISSIVKNLENFTRPDAEVTELCNLTSIIEQCLEIMNHRTRDRIKIIKEISNAELSISGNKGKLHQAFLNIIFNAEQAISKEGTITIKIGEEGNFVIVSIRDNGQGMEEKILSKIMDPFYTTKNPGEGTGLGLWVTYNVIKNHNGIIDIQSEVGKGTECIVSLPLNSD